MMKNTLFILLLFPLLMFGQSATEAGLYEVVYLQIEKGQEKAFEAAVKKHNAEYHAEDGLYHADLYYVVNGPYGGKYSWVMGPTSFTAMDSRPGEGAHNEDWNLVGKYVESAESPTYWAEDSDLTYQGTNSSGGKSLIWIIDLKTGKKARWTELVGKVNEVYKKQRPEESMGVYWNQFADTKAGMDVAIVFPFEKWAWLDRESKFYKDYEAVHGEETWAYFLSEINNCVDGEIEFLRERID